MTEERLEELMVKVTDQAASPAEHEELMAHLVEHPELRQELEAHQALLALTQGWVQRLDADLAEDRVAGQAAPRWLQRVALVLLAAGFLGMLSFSMHTAWMDPELPTWLAAAMGMLWAGFALFLISALHWKLKTHKHDPYQEVIR